MPVTATHCLPSGVLGDDQIPVSNVSLDNASILTPASGNARGVVVWYPGFPVGPPSNEALSLQPPASIGGGFPAAVYIDGTGGTGTVSYSSGNATINDTNATSDYVGKSVSPVVGLNPPPLNIPITAVVQTVNAGVSFTVQNTSAGLPTGNGTGVVVGGNQNTILGQNAQLALAQSLLEDGWIILNVPYPEEFTPVYEVINGTPEYSCGLSVQNDIVADPKFGARYKQTSILWRDHIAQFIYSNWGPQYPQVDIGGSWGGYHTLVNAAARPQYLAGYCAFIPGTVLSVASVNFTGPTNFTPATVNSLPGIPKGTSGLDLTSNILAGNNLPGAIITGTSDPVVGYSGTTVGSGSNGVNVSTFTGTQTLVTANNTLIVPGGAGGVLIKVATSTGFAWMQVGARSTANGTDLVNVKTLSGTGTLATGGAIIQSLADAIGAAAGNCTVTNVSGGGHTIPIAAVTAMMTLFTGSIDPNCPKTLPR